MAMLYDLGADLMAALADVAQAAGLSVDWRFVERFGDRCGICGCRAADHRPYMGVVPYAYIDATRRVAVPFWAAVQCRRSDDARMPALIRARLGEFVDLAASPAPVTWGGLGARQ